MNICHFVSILFQLLPNKDYHLPSCDVKALIHEVSFLYCFPPGAMFWFSHSYKIWPSLNPIPSNSWDISRIPMERIQPMARMSLQEGEIPLGVIASIVKTGKISRRERMKLFIHCFDLFLVFSLMKTQPFVFQLPLLLFYYMA